MIDLFNVVNDISNPSLMQDIHALLEIGSLSYGYYGKRLENEIQEYLQVEDVITFSSYSNALIAITSALGLNKNDKILLSPLVCLASVQPLALMGYDLEWAEVSPDTGMLDPIRLERQISNETKLVILNHFCGYIADVKRIEMICSSKNVALLNDGIEAFGSELEGVSLAKGKDRITIFSMQTVRRPNMIDGACIAINDKGLKGKLARFRDLGIDRSKFLDRKGEFLPSASVVKGALACAPNELQSLVGLYNLASFTNELNISREISSIYRLFFKQNINLGIKLMPELEGSRPNYWVQGVIVGKEKSRLVELFKKVGIGVSSVHTVVSAYENFGGVKHSVAHDFNNKFLGLPCGPWVEPEELLNKLQKFKDLYEKEFN